MNSPPGPLLGLTQSKIVRASGAIHGLGRRVLFFFNTRWQTPQVRRFRTAAGAMMRGVSNVRPRYRRSGRREQLARREGALRKVTTTRRSERPEVDRRQARQPADKAQDRRQWPQPH